MCEEKLQGVLDESPNTPPHHPPFCNLFMAVVGVGWGLQDSPVDLFDDAAKFGYDPAIVVGFEGFNE